MEKARVKKPCLIFLFLFIMLGYNDYKKLWHEARKKFAKQKSLFQKSIEKML